MFFGVLYTFVAVVYYLKLIYNCISTIMHCLIHLFTRQVKYCSIFALTILVLIGDFDVSIVRM